MSITRNLLICVWNILRYSLRTWNGKQKAHDIEKIALYAELAWTLSEGKVIKIDNPIGAVEKQVTRKYLLIFRTKPLSYFIIYYRFKLNR